MRILVVDDEGNIRDSLRRLLELEGYEARAAAEGGEAAALLAEEAFDALVLDLKMPGMDGQALLEWMDREGLRTPVLMISAHGELEDAVRALKSGASDYLVKPFDPAELLLRLRSILRARRREDLVEAGARTRSEPGALLGEARAMKELRRLIERAAAGSSTVLVTGESGTGKELAAREIHALSPRSAEPFVAVNLGALPESLAESELFGHERGAFTGAEARRAGLFELAGAGSLFLDEIGELPLPLQVKLLRVLQERKIRRLGGSRDIPVEARIIAATNRDLEAALREGRFREDLYYRLDVLRIRVPPLRERREDIALLSGAILGRIRSRAGGAERRLTAAGLAALEAYGFPGNVRELENILERAAVGAEGPELGPAELGLAPAPGEAGPASARPALPTSPGGPSSLEALEIAALRAALAKWGGNRSKAALDLGIGRRTLLYKLKRYGLG